MEKSELSENHWSFKSVTFGDNPVQTAVKQIKLHPTRTWLQVSEFELSQQGAW